MRQFALLFVLLFPLLAQATAQEAPGSILVPTCKTSIYVGSVTMELSPFKRTKDGYEATYKARVFPFFFLSEHGTLRIEASVNQLERLQRGEQVDFTGSAVTSSGEPRHIEGRATPSTPLAGSLKIRVSVSKSIRLAFPGSYRFGD